MKKQHSILFVCLGNICRSPIAEGVAKKIIKEQNFDLYIESRGTGTWHVGEQACFNSRKVCKLHNVDIENHRAKTITQEDIQNFDTIIALDDKNISSLEAMGIKNLKKLGFYGFDNQDVPDPYFFNGFDGFEKVYNMIEISVDNLLKNLVK